MATDLVGNVKLQRFIELLAQLNHLSADALKTGKLELLTQMNGVIKEMYSIQHFGEEDAYTAIEEDAQVIYKNFDAISLMVKSNEDGSIDSATSTAVRKFLRNIFEATVNIVTAYGLV